MKEMFTRVWGRNGDAASLLIRVSIISIAIFTIQPAHADLNLINNGGFESGDFTGWQRSVQSGSPGNFQIATGVVTPSEQFPTVGPASGDFYAVTDSNAPDTDGPSAYSLIQAFTLPGYYSDTDNVSLSFSLFVNDWNGAGALNTTGTLDYTQATPTQFARVDLLTSSALPFSTDEGDIVRSFYLGTDGLDPAYPYTDYNFNITAQTVPGQSYQLRFAGVANQFSLNIGVDNVSVTVAAPEPATISLVVFPTVMLARRKRNVNRS